MRTLASVTDIPAWIAAGVTLAALVVAFLTYRSQRGIRRIEYAAITNRRLLPGRVTQQLEVRHGGRELLEPSLAIVRMVNTGDEAIRAADYESDLRITFEGVREIASAIWTGSRPTEVRPAVEVDGSAVRVKPTLINPEDMLELQVLSAGKAKKITVSGRVADLEVVQKPGLPYPPGSGREGEMIGMDKFMWWIFNPGLVLAFGIVGAVGSDKLTTTARVLVLVGTGVVVGVLYPLYVRSLVRRRRLWRR